MYMSTPRSSQLAAKSSQSRSPACSSTAPSSAARTQAKPSRATAHTIGSSRSVIAVHVGWVERSETHRKWVQQMMGVAALSPSRRPGLVEVRSRLFVDAAQQAPVAEQIARADLARRQS